MKRLPMLIVAFAVLVFGYVALRWFSKPAAFEAPQALRFDGMKPEAIDELRLVFGDGKQIDVRKTDGQWFVNDAPADESKIQGLIDDVKGAAVTSRASSNKQYHDRFEVDGKGVRLTMLAQDQVQAEFIVGKTAGGDSVYVRVPDQDEVFVMTGVQRYSLSEEANLWRGRQVASVAADRIRRVTYNENQIQWDLVKSASGWSLGTNRIAAASVDAGKTDAFLSSVASISAVDFPSKEDVEAARKNRSTFATVVLEIGTVESFERKETWYVYPAQDGRYIIVRDAETFGYLVTTGQFDDVFSDFAAMKTKLTLTEAEKAAAKQ